MHRSLSVLVVVIVFFSVPFRCWADPLPFSLVVQPAAIIPTGTSAESYSLGFGATLTGQLPFNSSRAYLGLGASYGFLPTEAATSVTVFDGGIGGGLRFGSQDSSRIEVDVATLLGGYLSSYVNELAGNPAVMAMASVSFRASPGFSIGAGASYRYYMNFDAAGSLTAPLFEGVSVVLSGRFSPGGRSATQRSRMRIDAPVFQRVFPVFYRYYDTNSLGNVVVTNGESGAVSDVSVTFYVPQFMDGPKVIAEIPMIAPGESTTVPLRALFNNEVMAITETTSSQATIAVAYEFRGYSHQVERNDRMDIQNRNQMTWDDDRKAAAFVTAGDPNVQRFSRNITAATRGNPNTAVNERLRNAMALHEALGLYGMTYVIDPDSSYQDLSEDVASLDYLQFPAQTLLYRAGDCDDLSILYASLLEAIGIPAAFVTIPGHIFVAFDTGIPVEQRASTFAADTEVIEYGGTVWIPVETTLPHRSFLEAWHVGARQYRENLTANRSALFPIREAWTVYSVEARAILTPYPAIFFAA